MNSCMNSSMMSSGMNSQMQSMNMNQGMMGSGMNSMMSSGMNSQSQNMIMNQGMMGMGGLNMNCVMANIKRDNSFIFNINSPIIVPEHDHPLIFCLVNERNLNIKSWICNKCKSEFNSSIPSFYCTFCCYDLCESCVGKYQLNELKVFDSFMDDFKNISTPSKNEEKIPWAKKMIIINMN